ncbi:MAG TPA: hypothetical protein VFQ37_04335 [Mycobacterium sp.]|nr:hypothetical protein [Mycobacterium sp.]
MSRNRNRPDGLSASFIGIVFVVAVLWWLRWIILAVLVTTAVVLATRWFLRWQAQRHAAELARLDAIRQRAELQNDQVLRGDPAGFFGQYPVPDPELIPAWYAPDYQA